MTTAVTTNDCVISHNELAATVVFNIVNNNNQTFRVCELGGEMSVLVL